MNRKCRIPVVLFEDWPNADQDGWNLAIRECDILHEPGRFTHYSSKHIEAMRMSYGLWLGFLQADLNTTVRSSGHKYLTRDRIVRFLEGLQFGLAPWSVIRYLENVGCAVRGMFPDTNVDFIFAAGLTLRRTAKPTKNKRHRLRPTSDLFELGMDLMSQTQHVGHSINAALTYRDGLMIALLALRPLRAGNFTSIRIGRHLIEGNGNLWLEFPAEEVKNRRPLEFPFPDQLVAPLRQYMKRYRPILLSRKLCLREDPSDALWPGYRGKPMSRCHFGCMVGRRTRERFGEPINPHLFRDCAATSIAIDDPAHVHIIIRILGHSTLAMSERHYNQATSIEAARHMQGSLRRRFRCS